jgi:CheY-like chemotaxis protein
MTQPLALVLYERLLPGSQLVNRLQDLGYRVLTASGAEALVTSAESEKPMVVLADLSGRQSKVSAAIARLKQNPATGHLPVIAFSGERDQAELEVARKSGADLVVTEVALLAHLQQFLEQALEVK